MIVKEEVVITPFKLPRTLHIYLPKHYDESDERYSVLYMYDGHNLFHDEDATYGKSWKMEEYLDFIEASIIVVGIECNHEGNERLNEFCPFDVDHLHFGRITGKGEVFMDWVVEELKPYIDKTYRTLTDREHTGIGGSSMGGLMALYSVARYNEYFSKAASLSPAVSFCFQEIINMIKQYKIAPDTKVYIDWGSDESRNKQALTYACSRNLEIAHLFSEQGASIYPRIIINGKHNESTWEQQVPIFIDYLFKNIEKDREQ